jgi:hypothetical protein
LRDLVRQYVSQARVDWEIPYMMGTLQCWMPPPYTEHGRALLTDLLRNSRDIPLESYKRAESILQKCDGAHAKDALIEDAPANASASAHTDREDPRPSVSGKGGVESRSVASSKTLPADVSIAELKARVFSLEQSDQALSSALKRIPEGTGAVNKNFDVIVEKQNQEYAKLDYEAEMAVVIGKGGRHIH